MRLDENLSEEIRIFGLEKGNTISTIYNRELKYSSSVQFSHSVLPNSL